MMELVTKKHFGKNLSFDFMLGLSLLRKNPAVSETNGIQRKICFNHTPRKMSTERPRIKSQLTVDLKLCSIKARFFHTAEHFLVHTNEKKNQSPNQFLIEHNFTRNEIAIENNGTKNIHFDILLIVFSYIHQWQKNKN